ncbi:hypothetical protein [Limimaricola soesokkakensis]|uniref:hypothetical protein n=1 Tax=Limimaricola soesokkakensis TaxID=1343159 RepID=UPI0035120B73
MMTDPGLRPLALLFIAAGFGVLMALLISIVTEPGRQIVAAEAPEPNLLPALSEADQVRSIIAWPK